MIHNAQVRTQHVLRILNSLTTITTNNLTWLNSGTGVTQSDLEAVVKVSRFKPGGGLKVIMKAPNGKLVIDNLYGSGDQKNLELQESNMLKNSKELGDSGMFLITG